MRLRPNRKVIQSGTVSYTFGGIGVVAVPVAVAGVNDLSRVVERLLGYTYSANDYYDVSLELVSTTQLIVHIRANAAGTMYVDYDIVASDGKVQRGYASMTSALVANATINAVDVTMAKVFNNGLYLVSTGATLGGYKPNNGMKLVDPTPLQISRSAFNTNNETRHYFAVES